MILLLNSLCDANISASRSATCVSAPAIFLASASVFFAVALLSSTCDNTFCNCAPIPWSCILAIVGVVYGSPTPWACPPPVDPPCPPFA